MFCRLTRAKAGWTASLLLMVLVTAGRAQPELPHAPLVLKSAVQDKNFYLLSLLERDAEVMKALAGDEDLARLGKSRRMALEQANCESCLQALRFSDSEIAAAGTSLRKLYERGGAVRGLVDGPLRASGAYVRYAGKAKAELLVAAWSDSARGINRLIDVYALGEAPRYPAIDSPAFDVKSENYGRLLAYTFELLVEKRESMPGFFQPSLRFGVYLLEWNHRDNAGRHEPLDQHENRAALRSIPSIAWDRYPYTVIVVPGAGSDRPTWNMSPLAKLRAELAAIRYRQGKAPLILVSGGYVHPDWTPFAEAIEMKRTLMSDFGIPEAAILVDPHARHTTTNMRNAAREIYRYGIPFDRKALVTTDRQQSAYIESDVFTKRCSDELGYLPHRLKGRTSPQDLEFVPAIESLHVDPTDPLDP